MKKEKLSKKYSNILLNCLHVKNALNRIKTRKK